MATVQEARQQVEATKQAIATQKSRAEEQQRLLEAKRQELQVRNTEQSVRSNMAGLSGRLKRKQLQVAEQQVDTASQSVESYQAELQKSEAELKRYEAETLAPAESAFAEEEAKRRRYEVALKYYKEGKEPSSVGNLEVRRLLQQMYTDEETRFYDRPKAVVKKSEVFIDGQGYSVAPEKMDAFVESYNRSYKAPEAKPKPVSTYTALDSPRLETIQRNLAQKDNLLAGAAASAVSSLIFARDVFSKPKETFTSLGKGIKETGRRVVTGEGFPELGEVLRTKPKYATGFVAGEIATAKGTGVIFEIAKAKGSTFLTRLDPRYSKIVGEDLALDSGKVIKVIDEGAREIAISIPEQARLAGKNVEAVSGSRDLFGFFEKNKRIDKPLPNEESLTPTTRAMLEDLRSGKLPEDKIPELNLRIKAEARNKGLLEKSFFADPFGRARIKRLGIEAEKRASFVDVLSGDFTTKANRPQIIYFPETKVQELPANLRIKLIKGEPLTTSESNQLLKFQLEKSGQFKPVGFITGEPEVTLAPGEIIVKERTAAVTIINGKRVAVIEASIGQASNEVNNLLKQQFSGTINDAGQKKLASSLTSQTGLSYTLSDKPYLNPSKSATGYSFSTSSSVYSPRISSSSSKLGISNGYSNPLVSKSVTSYSPKINYKPNYMISSSSDISGLSYNPSSATYSSPISKSSYKPRQTYQPKKNPNPYSPTGKRFTATTRIASKSSSGLEVYEALGKRFGKDITLGKYKTQAQAEEKVLSFLKGGLGASAKVLKNTKELEFKELGLSRSKEFRQSKKEISRIVQLERFRLGTSPEKREINYFREKKYKKTKLLNI